MEESVGNGYQSFYLNNNLLGHHSVTLTGRLLEQQKRLPVHEKNKEMFLNQFQQVKRYLHISDPSGDSTKSFSFNKDEPALQHVVNSSKHS